MEQTVFTGQCNAFIVPIPYLPNLSDPVFVVCAQQSPLLDVYSDLLWPATQVVIVNHGHHQKEYSAKEQQDGGVW